MGRGTRSRKQVARSVHKRARSRASFGAVRVHECDMQVVSVQISAALVGWFWNKTVNVSETSRRRSNEAVEARSTQRCLA